MKKPTLTKRDFELITIALDICASDYCPDTDYKGNTLKNKYNRTKIAMQKRISRLETKLGIMAQDVCIATAKDGKRK